jgi:hypothetical protein
MRDTLLTALLPTLLALLTALAGWVSREAQRYLSRRTYALDREALKATAASVVADLTASIVGAEKATDAWTPERQAEVKALAVARVRALEPIAVANVARGTDAARVDALLGALVEQAVAAAKVRS